METILSKPVPNRFDLQFTKNFSPADAGSIWHPIVDMMLSLSNQLSDAFSRNRISNESLSKAVPNFVGVVASIKDIQKERFDKYAANVALAP